MINRAFFPRCRFSWCKVRSMASMARGDSTLEGYGQATGTDRFHPSCGRTGRGVAVFFSSGCASVDGKILGGREKDRRFASLGYYGALTPVVSSASASVFISWGQSPTPPTPSPSLEADIPPSHWGRRTRSKVEVKFFCSANS